MDAAPFLLYASDAEIAAAVRCAVRRYVQRADLPLHRVLGVGTPLKARLALRNHYLRQALEVIEQEAGERIEAKLPRSPFEVLAHRAKAFELGRWEHDGWKHFDQVPAQADAIEAALFEARRFGEVMLCARSLRDIL